jgi:hypothetical protein
MVAAKQLSRWRPTCRRQTCGYRGKLCWQMGWCLARHGGPAAPPVRTRAAAAPVPYRAARRPGKRLRACCRLPDHNRMTQVWIQEICSFIPMAAIMVAGSKANGRCISRTKGLCSVLCGMNGGTEKQTPYVPACSNSYADGRERCPPRGYARHPARPVASGWSRDRAARRSGGSVTPETLIAAVKQAGYEASLQ